MDKSWMRAKNRFGPEYKQGVQEFMEFARYRADSGNRIRCPCRKCKNMIYKTLNKVEDDLFIVGIDQGYTWWIHHGEGFHQRVEATEVLADPIVPDDEDEDIDEMQDIIEDEFRGTIADTDFAATSSSQDIADTASSRSVVGESTLRRADIAEREVQQLRVIVDEIKEQLERQMEELERRQEELERQWEEQERRWEEQERRWEEQERRIKEEQERRWEEQERRIKEEQERMIEEMRLEYERQMQEMFQALAARFATNAPPPPPSSS